MSDAAIKLRALVRLAKEKISDDVPFDAITKLDLSDCGLSNDSLSEEHGFVELLPNLSILFLSNNHITEMPAVIGKFPKLQMVALKGNQMTCIHPDALQPQLRWLILTDNKLKEIPETIGRCVKLQKCMLAGNQITELPAAMANCTNLELIRLASNQLTEPPMHVLRLPNLRWVALADNPFLGNPVNQPINTNGSSHNTRKNQQVTVIRNLDETGGEVLGQGAGGVTRKMDYNGTTVAVKVYGGAVMTSDGLPETERKIAVAASQLQCPALIHVLGECEGTGSLVMEYLDNFASLAGPPSFETCSRDVYGGGRQDAPCAHLSLAEACNLVTVLLDALRQLHRRGITHSDFYAHNILVQRSNLFQVRLSDFGAAFFYDPSQEYGRLLQTIELRAYAVLVAEVAALVNEEEAPSASAAKRHFVELEEQCHKQDVTFDQVYVWWKQKQLAEMAKAFGVDDDE